MMDARIVSEILRRNEEFLRRHLVLSRTVLDKMHQQGLITDITRRKLLMHPTYKQVPLLLDSLQNRGLPSLRKFLEVLKETGHGYLVVILDTEAIPVGDVRSETTQPWTEHTTISRRPTTHAAQMVSLRSLLHMRQEHEATPRGSLQPRTLLTDPIMTGYQGGGTAVGVYGGAVAPFQPPVLRPASRRGDVPSTLYSLGQVFSSQQKENEQALVILRQEEMAIKQLMEQNARDQQKVRRKQYTMTDLSRKLADINARASEMYEPTPNPNIGRYRLAQLNQIPWSVDR